MGAVPPHWSAGSVESGFDTRGEYLGQDGPRVNKRVTEPRKGARCRGGYPQV
jgi:hypothetical protein